jgi:phage-related protein
MKKVLWVASSKRDLGDMPKATVRSFGYALFQAQMGQRPDIAKTFSGYGSADLVELVEDERGNTFRVVYTLQLEDAVIVLHSFQKKSKKGIETPKQDKDLIASRLKRAPDVYMEWKNKG